MPELHYPNPFTFTDPDRDERYRGPCTANVDEDAVDHYLERGWEWPEEADESSAEDESPDQEPASSGTGDPDHVDTAGTEDAGDRQGPTTDAEADPVADTAAEAEDGDGDGSGSGSGDDEPFLETYKGRTIAEVEDLLDEQSFTVDELREMLEHEQEDKDRSGAVDALEDALEDALGETESDATENTEE